MTYAIMSDADYKGICDTVREKTETSALLKSAEVAPAIRSIELGGTSLMLTVTTEAGATVTATKGSLSVTAVATNGTATLKLKEAGDWTVTATLNGQSNVVVVSVTDRYELSLKYAATASYTGTYTDEIVDMTDGKYYLLTLTGSGTLTFSAPTECDIWACGGGGGGGAGGSTTATVTGGGGGGGAVADYYQQTIQSLTIEIGAGGEGVASASGYDGSNTIVTGDIDLTAGYGTKGATRGVAGNGGCGGGGGTNASGYVIAGGTSAGVSTRPFKDASFEPLCGGGGGGGAYISKKYMRGGDGGSDGSAGAPSASVGSGVSLIGAGGIKGGGKGGYASVGGDADDFGGGGGGAGKPSSSGTLAGGAGYQGCVMIRVPYAGQQLTVITFTIAGVEYRTIRGWTWYAWVKSDYNTDGFLCYGTNAMPVIAPGNEQIVKGVVSNDVIQDGYAYSLENA